MDRQQHFEVVEQIQELKRLRLAIAERTRDLGWRELKARQLKAFCELELRKHLTKTDAEKEAKLAPNYLEYEHVTVAMAHERDVLFAEAEAARFTVQWTLIQAQAAAGEEVAA